jgi:HipA-like protein
MSETLEAIYDGYHVGTLSYAKDRLTFAYSRGWQENPNAFPLSLSMPLVTDEYADPVIRPFISGLLPDDPEVLKRWGRKFQVSPQNPFRLLAHVGEEYLLWKINQERWQKAAKEWGFTDDFVIEQIQRMASALPEAAQTAREEVAQLMGTESEILDRLAIEISQRARTCLAEISV